MLVPCYNTRQYLPQCLLSVLNQTYSDYDILIVDDRSTDDSMKVIESFCAKYSNISYIPKKTHTNVTDTTKIGIDMAQGSIVTIVDSDDVIFPNALSTIAPYFRDNKVGFVWSKFKLSNGGNGWSHGLPSGASLFEAMRQGWWKGAHHKFIRKSDYKRTCGLNSRFDRSSDYQLVFLMGLSGCGYRHVPEYTYWYRLGRQGSLTSQGRDKQRRVAKEIKEWISKMKPLSR